jgi:arginine N-succinyltransferase
MSRRWSNATHCSARRKASPSTWGAAGSTCSGVAAGPVRGADRGARVSGRRGVGFAVAAVDVVLLTVVVVATRSFALLLEALRVSRVDGGRARDVVFLVFFVFIVVVVVVVVVGEAGRRGGSGRRPGLTCEDAGRWTSAKPVPWRRAPRIAASELGVDGLTAPVDQGCEVRGSVARGRLSGTFIRGRDKGTPAGVPSDASHALNIRRRRQQTAAPIRCQGRTDRSAVATLRLDMVRVAGEDARRETGRRRRCSDADSTPSRCSFDAVSACRSRGPMFIIRDARLEDMEGLLHLAAVLNTVNLPNDRTALEELLQLSMRSFAGRVRNPLQREYLFVMEDTTSGGIVGTSQVIAQHGTREAPHIYFDVFEEERYSETIDRHFRHKVLRMGFDHDGPTEIGGLVLDPAFRRVPGKLGKQLSFVRFVFMAMHRTWFRPRVLAELLPPLLEGGKSVLWEALGRRFTGLTYLEADRISKTNKEFIKGLFPSGLIYATLFDDDAQRVIGEVGPQTEGVRKMLTGIGFAPVGRIDPFDGGPHFEANTDDLWPVARTRRGAVRIVDGGSLTDGPGESCDGLVAFERRGKSRDRDGSSSTPVFRCAQTDFREVGDTLELPRESAAALGVVDGDEVWALAMARHTRL